MFIANTVSKCAVDELQLSSGEFLTEHTTGLNEPPLPFFIYSFKGVKSAELSE